MSFPTQCFPVKNVEWLKNGASDLPWNVKKIQGQLHIDPKPQHEVGGMGGHWEEEKENRKNLLSNPDVKLGGSSHRPPVF